MKNGLAQDQLLAAARTRLSAVVKPLAAEKRQTLESYKRCHKNLKRPDFIWRYLIQSFATMGGAARAAGLKEGTDNYQRVNYETLAALTPKKREKQVHEVSRAAGLRWPAMKARYILGCFDYVRSNNGPEQMKALLLAQPGKEAKITFLRTFSGIGPKYARNLMMDVYHEDFRESIAIDARIKSISKLLGLPFSSSEYAELEGFYLDVAHSAGLNGWELDRLLFNFGDEVKERLAASDRHSLTAREQTRGRRSGTPMRQP